MRRVLTGIALGVFGAVVIITGLVLGLALSQSKAPLQVIGNFFVPKPQDLFGKDRIALLLVGIDYDYNEKDEETSAHARTDTIMTASLNFPTDINATPSVGLLSIPRDTVVTYPDGRQDKINAAYVDGGIKKSEAVIGDFLGIPGFDRYVVLRINATKSLIDAIGGIDIVPDETMDYDDNWGHLHIHFKGGKLVHMNGEQAVSYSRFRHDACSDPCRIKRQQQVVRTVLAKIQNDKLNDLVHIRELVDVVRRNVDTNLSAQEMVSVANAFASLTPKNVAAAQVPFLRDEDLACCGNVLVPDDGMKAKLVKQTFLSPLAAPVVAVSQASATVAASQAPPTAVAEIPPAKIRVEVRNGSGTPGVANRLAERLRKQGFIIANVGNADAFSYETTVIRVHSASIPLAGERVRSALSIATASVTPEPSTSPTTFASDVTVIVGRDFAASQ
ncbi:MAG TPA: LCP family protein [Candidatus Baltobacteraceae bacterium]|nr:LCP family protein [Candidatus Baltobacteraceae bacterium]